MSFFYWPIRQIGTLKATAYWFELLISPFSIPYHLSSLCFFLWSFVSFSISIMANGVWWGTNTILFLVLFSCFLSKIFWWSIHASRWGNLFGSIRFIFSGHLWYWPLVIGCLGGLHQSNPLFSNHCCITTFEFPFLSCTSSYHIHLLSCLIKKKKKKKGFIIALPVLEIK